MKRTIVASALLVYCLGCGSEPPVAESVKRVEENDLTAMNEAAESYVKMVLALGEHDADYVDAYYGPAEWREEVRAEARPLESIAGDGAALLETLRGVRVGDDEMSRLRYRYLSRQLESLLARIEMIRGEVMSFDEESKRLYDAVAPHHSEEHYDAILADLEAELPGEGTLADRFSKFRNRFVIPAEKLDAVFQTAIEACRDKTREKIDLPDDESFTVEYVNDKPWSGYNWYQGSYQSLIQVNTDLPIFIDRAIDLASHEGYPGHHVYNVLLEKNLMRERGWMEFSVYPLFSPQSLIAEGSANFGIEVAFPSDERIAFEQETLFPLAGLDPDEAGRYYRVLELTSRLSYAGNEAARRYLDGEIDGEAAAAWLTRYTLMEPDRAAQRVRFIDKYRAYVINYNLGKDLVRDHVEALGGTTDNPERRWEVFEGLLSSPRLPSGLAGGK